MILTNAELSKVSDMISQWWSIVIKFFKLSERNEEIVVQNNIVEKYYKAGAEVFNNYVATVQHFKDL